MVTSISSGRRQVRGRLSMLTQLPTPEDCISNAPRAPPSHAPASTATPSSSVVSVTTRIALSPPHSFKSRVWPASGTCATWRTSQTLS
jgi:hypothetical protein